MEARALLALLMAVAVAAGCTGADPPRPRNVVLITVDTLRADHLGLYGYDRQTSPHIDALAVESTVFESAVPTCPATAPSVASLLTGVHRATHDVFRNGSTLFTAAQTLAEILKARGYRTAARIANPVLDARFGFARGFDDFALPAALEQQGPGSFGGTPLVAEAERLLDAQADAPSFLWLHFMDPHGPYFPPEPYRALFRPEDYARAGEPDLPIADGNYGLLAIPKYQAVEGRRSPADYRARYDAEIRYTDDHVAAVIGMLRARGLWDRSLFVLTADHGESLGEHQYYFQHGWFAYDDCLRVPLLMRAPGFLPAGRRVGRSVSLIDVVPTILDVLALPVPVEVEGRTLLPLVRGAEQDRPALAQTYYGGEGRIALRRGRLKYVFTPPEDTSRPFHSAEDPPGSPEAREELYDLGVDPGETQDMSRKRVEVVQEMRHQVEEWLGGQQDRSRRQQAREKGIDFDRPDEPRRGHLRDQGIEQQLRALGYVN